MEHEINCSSDEYIKKVTFSGKKKYHTFTKLIAVTKEGYIWFVSKSFPGSNNDINLCNFPSNKIFKSLSEDEKIAGDDGFKGLEHFSIYTQIDAQTNEEEKFDKNFKHYRIVVENSIAQLRKWKIASHKFYSKMSDLSKALEEHHFIIEIVAGLVNKYIMPIRNYD